jgi:hypothetical protein
VPHLDPPCRDGGSCSYLPLVLTTGTVVPAACVLLVIRNGSSPDEITSRRRERLAKSALTAPNG